MRFMTAEGMRTLRKLFTRLTAIYTSGDVMQNVRCGERALDDNGIAFK